MATNIDPAPTTGLSTNVFVQLSGTGLTALNAPSTNHPNAGPYSLTLSLSSAGGNSNTCTMTPITVDASNATITSTAANWVIQSFGYWVGTEASVYSGSLNGANIAPKPTSTGKIASVSGGGTTSLVITAVAVGHCVVEVTYPTFGNTETGKTVSTGIPPANNFVTVPNDSIYSQILVTVIP